MSARKECLHAVWFTYHLRVGDENYRERRCVLCRHVERRSE